MTGIKLMIYNEREFVPEIIRKEWSTLTRVHEGRKIQTFERRSLESSVFKPRVKVLKVIPSEKTKGQQTRSSLDKEKENRENCTKLTFNYTNIKDQYKLITDIKR